ncbi:MAG: hypothetical protein GX237_10245 [Clostridiales bacterium]|nr:hypothetical protein [Clostridiales bacterium]
MLKHIYRIIILIAVFIASIYYFGKDIKEVVFDIDNTTVMEEATFPLVTIRTDGELINILHGYSSNLDANSIRDALTPISGDGSFEVLINQEDYEIKKLNFEVREFVGNELIEKGSVSVFQEEDDIKIAKINISSEIENGKEYAVKITLITSESRKMYYYHRIKKYQQTYINEKLDFVMSFHQATKDKEAIKEYSQNLEPNSKKDNTSLTHVNIHSSMDLISWGDLNPEFITDVIPTVVENYPDIASVVLEYIVRANVSGIPELYRVKEYYRIRYSPNQMYLLNYERRMESVFDSALASVSKSQLKLGITSDTDIAHISSPDKKKLVFVRNRELWFYNLEKNEMVRIFSFRQEETDYIRDMYEQHDIRILNMDAEGNVDFIVYGYMNRGHYEGRVAVILYRYIRNEQRIEEKVYIPVDEPYQTLKENLGEFAYVNSLDVFYFQIYDKIYAYDLITRQLTELAGNVDRDDVVVFYEEGYVAWQESSNPKEANSIKIMDLETSDIQLIVPKPGYKVILLDKIDSNLICGYVDEKDITTLIDGAVIVPMKNVEIVTTDREVLKPYSKPDFYIRGVEVKDNVIELFRSQKDLVGGRIYFQDTTNDYIMNKIVEKTPFIKAVPRITEAALTEYYMELPSSFIMEEEPSVLTTVNTVISQDPTLRLPKENDLTYYAFVMGELVGAYDEAADAIAVADEGVGVVRSSFKHLVWERGVNANRSVLNGFNNDDIISGDSLESSIKMLIKYTGKNIDNKKLDLINQSAYEILEEYLSEDPIRLTGTSLDQVMYFISQKRPVIAMTSRTDAVLIYGYDASNIYMVDPKQGKTIKMGIQDSQALFEEGGNVYLSYLE